MGGKKMGIRWAANYLLVYLIREVLFLLRD